jgi:tRNA(fMet)-specific endonuclease VapC
VAVLIDTSIIINLERGVANPEVEAAIGEEGRAISVITVSELLHGVHRTGEEHRTRRQAFVEHLLAGVTPIEITEPVARVHAQVWAQLSARGDLICAHDRAGAWYGRSDREPARLPSGNRPACVGRCRLIG